MLSGGHWKSAAEVTRLASTVLMAKDFCPEDLHGFNAYTKLKHFDASEKELDPDCPFHDDGWSESSITISVPTREQNPTGNGTDFTISGFFHQKLMAVVCATFRIQRRSGSTSCPLNRYGNLSQLVRSNKSMTNYILQMCGSKLKTTFRNSTGQMDAPLSRLLWG